MRKFENIEVPKKERIKLTKEDKKKIKEQKKLEKLNAKNMKKAQKSIYKYVSDILPIADLDDKDRIITKTAYMDIYQVATTDIYTFNTYEANLHIFTFIAFLRSYTNDMKLISMNFPVNTTTQQNYFKKKIRECTNEKHKTFLVKKLEELEFLEKHRTNREFYIMVFSEDHDIKHLMENVIKSQSKIFMLKPIDADKKVKILFKMNNLNSKII